MAESTKTRPAPLIVDTTKQHGATADPRGDNRPGVIPDQPAQPGIDPVTNLRTDLVDPETGAPRPSAEGAGETLNPHPADAPSPTEAVAPKGRRVRMIAIADIWPATKPPGWPEDKEYRVRAGESVDLPEEEAMDRMEAGTARRADRRA